MRGVPTGQGQRAPPAVLRLPWPPSPCRAHHCTLQHHRVVGRGWLVVQRLVVQRQRKIKGGSVPPRACQRGQRPKHRDRRKVKPLKPVRVPQVHDTAPAPEGYKAVVSANKRVSILQGLPTSTTQEEGGFVPISRKSQRGAQRRRSGVTVSCPLDFTGCCELLYTSWQSTSDAQSAFCRPSISVSLLSACCVALLMCWQ